jgi:hypothetical protein
MSDIYSKLPPWLGEVYHNMILPRRSVIQNHKFVRSILDGSAEHRNAECYFSGLMWHLLDFGVHVKHLFAKRPDEVSKLLVNRSEDTDGDTEILGRIVTAFGGPVEMITKSPWRYAPHRVWIQHDALLRSAIYSQDLPWQVGVAALNVGIESLVPYMIEPLFRGAVKNYGVSTKQAQWLESRSGEAEIQHGENGYIILSEFVESDDEKLKSICLFYIDALSRSMAYGLLESGLARSEMW